ncbi:hypothetical protein MRB53_041189 [Persea americana]|nr:hypothetical protein MRB53_041189 [Persea americana]
MSTPLLLPQCTACCRRWLRDAAYRPLSPLAQVQIRGKKKTAQPKTTITIKLLKDLPAFGRKGTFVAVPIGQMRNYLFPRRIADYATMAQQRALRESGESVERDFGFRREDPSAKSQLQDAGVRTSPSAPRTITVNFMEPQAAFDFMSEKLPPALQFYRAVNKEAHAEPQRPQATSDANADPIIGPLPLEGLSIYGSVSTADVAISLRAVLQELDPDGRIPLEDSDVRFVRPETGEDETDRIKRLGEYDIEIKVRGHEEGIRRKVLVLQEVVQDVPTVEGSQHSDESQQEGQQTDARA